MSEKLYARLLRLFPSHFRSGYGDEALQLFRDRARDETGIFRRIRLWLDLLADLAISLPQEYRRDREGLVHAAPQLVDGVPTFAVLTDARLSFGPLSLGGALSLLLLASLPILLNLPENRPAISGTVFRPSRNHSGFRQPNASQVRHEQANGVSGNSSNF